MSAVNRPRPLDSAVIVAQSREDVVVGNEIVRHNRFSRLVHWTVALTFFVCILTGMPIWTPVFGWMAHLFGGLTVCRVIHPWAGIAFFLASIFMFFMWLSDMHIEPGEKDWLRPKKMLRYMRYETDDQEVGKYNGGQKIYFWAAGLGALGFLASGLLMWFPGSVSRPLMEIAILVHDVTFILFAVSLVGHMYLGTAAEPGTFGSMTRGTVTRAWARLHHPRWYRDVTGEQSRNR
jgi:formate dehydrogenase subunit gamma